MDDIQDLLPIFISEAQDGVAKAREHLHNTSIDNDVGQQKALIRIARSLMGNAQFFAFPAVVDLCKEMIKTLENPLFDKLAAHSIEKCLQQIEACLRQDNPAMVIKEVKPPPPMPPVSKPSSEFTADDLELLDDFLQDTEEHLQQFSDALNVLVNQPRSKSSLNQAFRNMHTIKGNAGFLKLDLIETISHHTEDLLSKVRKLSIPVTQQYYQVFMRSHDLLHKAVLHILHNRTKPQFNFDSLLASLQQLNSQPLCSPEPPSTQGPTGSIQPTVEIFRPIQHQLPADTLDLLDDFIEESRESIEQFKQNLTLLETSADDPQAIANAFRMMHTIKGNAGFLQLPTLEKLSGAGEELLANLRDNHQTISSEQVAVLLGLADGIMAVLNNLANHQGEGFEKFETLQNRLQQVTPLNSTEPTPKAVSTNNTIRISTKLVDNLMNLVSELVLAQNQIQPLHTGNSIHNQIGLLIDELQHNIQKTRLQPISLAFRKIPRLVRELSQHTNKRVELHLHGESTELDKQILEAIQDPLLHFIRNAIDHGIESPEQRMAVGKPPHGNITVKASQQGGQVIITIHDDGAGICAQKIMSKAIERGYTTAAESNKLAKHQLLDFIFQPGFSTRDQASNISGRGVGMDIIKQNIESLAGTIQINSQVGQGTTFTVQIPLTLAIVPVLVIRCAEHTLLIPQQVIERLHTFTQPATTKDSITSSYYSFSGQQIPYISLRAILQCSYKASGMMVVCKVKGDHFGILVDQIDELQETILKPLHPYVAQLSYSSATTILPNGLPALALDIPAIAEKYNLLGTQLQPPQPLQFHIKHPYLIFYCSPDSHLALPFITIQRLTKISAQQFIEHQQNQCIRLSGTPLPIVTLPQEFSPLQSPQEALLLICQYQKIQFGIVCKNIIDFCPNSSSIDTQSPSPNYVSGTFFQNEHLVTILNSRRLVNLLPETTE